MSLFGIFKRPSPPAAVEQCKGCAFYDFAGVTLNGWTAGYCKRHAPAQSGGRYDGGAWPLVQERDWCGDYKTKALTQRGSQA